MKRMQQEQNLQINMEETENTNVYKNELYSRTSGLNDENSPPMEETENAKVYQIDLYSRTASLNEEDSPSTAVENASLLYCLFLHSHCRCNMEVIKWRRYYDSLVMAPCKMAGEEQFVIVGSAAEGVYIYGSSDTDIMLINKSEICCDEDCIEDINHNNYSKVLIAHRRHASPGYTLVLDLADYFRNDVSKGKTYEESKTEINELVVDRKVQTIALSVQDYIKHISIKHVGLKDIPTHGPACWLKLSDMISNNLLVAQRLFNKSPEADSVYAISFICNDILRDWLNRKRTQGWPPEELKRQISEMPGHVVPVGRKGSEFEEYEWRICYTQAEIKLVHSLNEVQLMLYFKLKVFSNTVLKDVCSDITSYIIKNVIFWLAESVPNKYFQCKYFIPLFRATLVCLRKCVRNRYLPNFMIPERNLFAGKLEGKEQDALIDVLSYWIEKCPILEEEKDILPLYKDVVSRKTDKYVNRHVALIQNVKNNIAMYASVCFPTIVKIHELRKSGDTEATRAYLKRITGLTDTELSNFQNADDTFGGIKALFETKILRGFNSILNIILAQRIKKGPKLIEPELD